jgi:hypothetical protein
MSGDYLRGGEHDPGVRSSRDWTLTATTCEPTQFAPEPLTNDTDPSVVSTDLTVVRQAGECGSPYQRSVSLKASTG